MHHNRSSLLTGSGRDGRESDQFDIGYYSGREFSKLSLDLAKSYCSSVADVYEEDVRGKGHVIQPFDFFVSRKTKRFFREDFLNLTKAATNKDYI